SRSPASPVPSCVTTTISFGVSLAKSTAASMPATLVGAATMVGWKARSAASARARKRSSVVNSESRSRISRATELPDCSAQSFDVRGGSEVAPTVSVPVVPVEDGLEREGLAKPARVEARFVEIEEAGDHEGVVLEVGSAARPALEPAPLEAFAPPEATEDEV